MTSKIRTECVVPSLQEGIELELEIFDRQFAEIQTDKVGLSPSEKMLLRTYLIWKMHVRTEDVQPE